MFPIIPHHLRLSIDAYPSPKVAHFVVEVPPPATAVEVPCPRTSGVASWESPCRVLAGEDVGCDVISEEFGAESLMVDGDLARSAMTRRVTLTRGGRLSCSVWVRHLRLSADCHTCNVLLQRAVEDPNKLRLQVIRPLREGDELHMWFAQPTLAALGVPFLRPANIQGEKRYVCHLCAKPFETPNPLKVHLALGCLPIDKNRLYSRLLVSKTPSRHAQDGVKTSASSFTLSQVKPDPDTICQPRGANIKHEPNSVSNHLSLLTLVKTEPADTPRNPPLSVKRESEVVKRPRSIPSPSRRVSVHSMILPASRRGGDDSFRYELPMKSRVTTPSAESGFVGVPRVNMGSAFRPYWKPREGGEAERRSPEERAQVGSFHPGGESVYFAQAREMETLVSNLGRSKHGHLCVYCGKVYSRKYGLKIHIRTHTGFKPLQCRHCLRPFGDPSNLNKHVRLHAEGSTPYKCDLCGKVLVRRRDLERHIKSRHSTDSIDGTDS